MTAKVVDMPTDALSGRRGHLILQGEQSSWTLQSSDGFRPKVHAASAVRFEHKLFLIMAVSRCKVIHRWPLLGRTSSSTDLHKNMSSIRRRNLFHGMSQIVVVY